MSEPTTVAFAPTSAEQREDPFPVLAHARREQPVFFAPDLVATVLPFLDGRTSVPTWDEQLGGGR